jgi:hypothetical protein
MYVPYVHVPGSVQRFNSLPNGSHMQRLSVLSGCTLWIMFLASALPRVHPRSAPIAPIRDDGE